MKQKNKTRLARAAMTLLLALLTTFGAWAQTTVTIGEGTSASYYNPLSTYYNYSITEQLYTADEIGMAGSISSISFNYVYNTANKEYEITVYMANVDAEDLSTGISLADADEVFSGTISITETGWVTINLDTPFAYDGTSNLLIGINKTSGSEWFSGNTWQYTTTETHMARYTQNDSNPYTISTVPGSATKNRPNIQMVITPGSGPVCDKPATLEVTDITGYSATCTWTSEVGNYTFEYKKASASDWTVVSGLTSTSYTLSNLEPFTAYNVRVKAVCGTDLESGYKTANFTTPEVCPDGKVCIGTGTATNSYLPTYTYYNYSLTQQIYTADEIGESGAIMSIDFYSTATERTRNLDIYMVMTEKASFADNTDFITTTASDLVYSGNVTFVKDNWTTIQLNTPFAYADDTKNVALIVVDKTGGYVDSPSFRVFDATNMALYAYNDYNEYDPSNPGTYTNGNTYTFTKGNVKNRIRLEMGEIVDCDMPTNLAVSNITMESANLTWTAGGSETAWQVCINGDEDNLIDVTNNTYQMTGLTAATTYTVKVRANCGNGQSYWTPEISFNTAICDATAQCEINYEFSMTSTSYTTWHSATIDVVDVETNIVLATLTYDAAAPTGKVAVCDGREIKFVYNPASPSFYNPYNAFTFTDVNGEEIFSGVGDSNWTESALLYTYTVNCTVTSCRKPTDLAASEIVPHSAKLSWTENGEATAWKICVNGDTENLIDADTNPYTLTGLAAETQYTVKVAPVCEVEKWSDEITLTTAIAAPAPTDLAATHVTATSATLNWEGFGSEYNVRYAAVSHGTVLAEQNFDEGMGDWTTIDADGDGNNWGLMSVFNFNGTPHSGSDMIVSMSYYDGSVLTPDNYLVSPQITIDGSISFWACAQDASYPSEHFGVAVSTTGNTDAADFTTIWESTMVAKGGNDRGNSAKFVIDGVRTKPTTTRSGNRTMGTWYHFIIDLSTYAGQTGYVALRHFNCTDQFYLDVDDILIATDAPEMQWTELSVSDNSVDLTGLEAETEYQWQVQANCGDDGISEWSNLSTFTTGSFSDDPIDLETSDIMATTATLNWAGSQDSYNVQYRTAEVTEEYYFTNFNAGFDAVQAEGWTWDGAIIYGFDDPIYNIPYNENYFLQMGWATTDEATIVSPELPAYESGAHVEFYYFGYNTANTFQVGFSTTTNDAEAFTWSEPIEAPLIEYTLFSEELPAGVKYVAFKATASEQNASIFIDDFRIYKLLSPAGEWISAATTTEATLALTGLTTDTKYDWQVQGNYDGGTTEWVSSTFTTLDGAIIKFAAEGYATYYNGAKDVVLPAGMKAQVVTDGNTTLTYAPIADGDTDDNVVPAATAMLLQVEPSRGDQEKIITLTTPTATSYAGTNLLHGSDTETTTTGGTKYYKLTYSSSGTNFGWYYGATNGGAFSSPAHKAWLALGSSGAPSFLGLPDWDTTGIVPVSVNPEDGEWYTLQGMKIGKKPTTTGVYIHNGRKVIVK